MPHMQKSGKLNGKWEARSCLNFHAAAREEEVSKQTQAVPSAPEKQGKLPPALGPQSSNLKK